MFPDWRWLFPAERSRPSLFLPGATNLLFKRLDALLYPQLLEVGRCADAQRRPVAYRVRHRRRFARAKRFWCDWR
ncbi:hypothetical protein P4233_01675 [Pseudomonas aeruginosa]|nr:hypothetical protein [Pseudomonas aeruginosa]